MAQVTLNLNPFFPSGTSVGVYQTDVIHDDGPPPGPSVFTGTVASDGTLTVTGLVDNTEYVAAASISGKWRTLDFKTPPVANATNVQNASNSVIGVARLSVAPAVSTNPIAVGDNDPRLTSGSVPGYYDITDYGASTGATDNTTAIQAAINAAKSAGGVVTGPSGIFKYASPLNCDLPSKGFSIAGPPTGPGEVATTPFELRYTGTTSPAISCHSVYGFGLRNVRFTYDNAGFTGDLIDIDGGPHAADCTNWSIERCSSLHINTITARSIIRMNKAINGMIRDCGLGGAVNILRIGDPGGSYVVGLKVENSTFNYASNAMILFGSGDGENIILDFNRYEASNNTTAIRGASVATDGSATQLYNPAITNSWFGDAGSTLTWVKDVAVVSNKSFGTFAGNRMATPGAGGVHAGLIGSWISYGNSFEGSIAYGTATNLQNLVSFGNYFNDTGTVYQGGRPTLLNAFGNTPAGTTPAADVNNIMPARLALGSKGGGTNSPGSSGAAFAGSSNDIDEQLVLGAIDGTAPVQVGAKSAVYQINNSGWAGHLVLQPPTDGTVTNEIWLCGGTTTPTPVVRTGNAKLGFFNTVPVVKPAISGSRGGNAALASLLTALAGMGLITDSTTA